VSTAAAVQLITTLLTWCSSFSLFTWTGQASLICHIIKLTLICNCKDKLFFKLLVNKPIKHTEFDCDIVVSERVNHCGDESFPAITCIALVLTVKLKTTPYKTHATLWGGVNSLKTVTIERKTTLHALVWYRVIVSFVLKNIIFNEGKNSKPPLMWLSY